MIYKVSGDGSGTPVLFIQSNDAIQMYRFLGIHTSKKKEIFFLSMVIILNR